ncbi:MAG: hypothetical protein J1F35_04870 [Erysipelotrichales bacterium]|nr:hypothetical protein [Erysipelotrichales bacterium]
MEKLEYSSADFLYEKYLFDNDYFYKIIIEDEKAILDLLLEKKELLQSDNYSLPIGYYLTQDGELCYKAKNLKDYRTISYLFKLGMSFDVKRIASSMATSFEELKSIGISYWDFHDENVLLDKESNIKLIDLDSCEILEDAHLQEYSIHRLVEMVFHLMIVSKKFKSFDSMPTFMDLFKKYSVVDLYDNDVKEFLSEIYFSNTKSKDFEIVPLVERICEEEKVEEVKRRVLEA